jgi:transcriptional regulator with XRE-family HTH domain
LKNRMIELGLTQGQVASLFNTDSDLIYMWEKNMVKPTVKRFPVIIQFLGYFPFEVDTSTLGGQIKEYRYVNGLSQEEMAAYVGIDECTLQWYENGKRIPQERNKERVERMIRGKSGKVPLCSG